MKDTGTKRRRDEGTKGKRACARAGFTATEIMIVIAIMVLLLAMAVPAFNFITGSRSTGAAENLVSAMLGRGRAYAMSNNRKAGVAFFVDPATGRTTMALVEGPGQNEGYLGWTSRSYIAAGAPAPYGSITDPNPPTQPAPPTANTPYDKGTEVVARAVDGTTVPAPVATGSLLPANWHEGKVIIRGFVAVPPTVTPGQAPPDDPPGIDANWDVVVGSSDIELVPDSDFQALPPGVGCQLINDPKQPPQYLANRNIDRYVRTGVILFDSQGRLTSSPLQFRVNSNLGATIGLTVSQPLAGTPFYTQLGVVLYDKQAFLNQPNNSEGDWVMNQIPTLQAPSSANNETDNNPATMDEEQWIDQNSLPLFVNRFNGNLLRGE
jgi:prepilin-type N-terminal cleavage/methylation domain-containing protein